MGWKEKKVRHLNVKDVSMDHLHLFAQSCTPFFIHIYSIQVATSPTFLHHPPLTITTSVTTTINETTTTTTTATIINVTTNTTLDSVTWPLPSPTLTGQPPWQQLQQQQGAWDRCVLSPRYVFLPLLMILLQSVTFTIHHPPSTIHHSPSPHHTTKVTSKMHQKHVHHNDMSKCYENSSSSSQGAWDATCLEALVLFFLFLYTTNNSFFVYTHHLASNSSSRLKTQGMFTIFKN